VTHRRLIQPAFHRSALRSAADLIVQRTQSMLAACTWPRRRSGLIARQTL